MALCVCVCVCVYVIVHMHMDFLIACSQLFNNLKMCVNLLGLGKSS